MDLNILWFILLTVLFSGFFFLEGFDYGVGMLLPFVAKTDNERRAVINTIGPVWDGNEVWMITAGGGNVRGLSTYVRHPLQWILRGPGDHAAWPDRPRRGL